jgi:hypothetical protein
MNPSRNENFDVFLGFYECKLFPERLGATNSLYEFEII